MQDGCCEMFPFWRPYSRKAPFLRCENHWLGADRQKRRVIKRVSGDHLAEVKLPQRVRITAVCVCVSPAVKGDDHSCVFDLRTAGAPPPF